MLALLELTDRRAAHPYDLSGGEQQRLALGKILLRQPQILLLDEPTKGLDPFFKASLAKLLKSLLARGLTLFMVSHDIEFCAEYGDTCALFFCLLYTSTSPPATPRRGRRCAATNCAPTASWTRPACGSGRLASRGATPSPPRSSTTTGSTWPARGLARRCRSLSSTSTPRCV